MHDKVAELEARLVETETELAKNKQIENAPKFKWSAPVLRKRALTMENTKFIPSIINQVNQKFGKYQMMMMLKNFQPIQPKEIKERFTLDVFRIIRDEYGDDQAFYNLITASKMDYEIVDGKKKALYGRKFTQENLMTQIIAEFLENYKYIQWNWMNELIFNSIYINVVKHKLALTEKAYDK